MPEVSTVPGGGMRSTASILLWIGLANVCLYAFAAILARRLGPSEYGLFAAVFGVVGLAGLALGGLQTAVASAVAAGDERDRFSAVSKGSGAVMVLSLAVIAVFAAVSPLLQSLLRTESILPPLAAALIIGVLVPWSAALGVYQGARSFGSFGRLTFLQALMRLCAVLLLLVTTSVTALLIAVAVLAIPPTVVAVLPHYSRQGMASLSQAARWTHHNWIPLTGAFAVALVAGFPTLGDVVLARRVLPADEAGLYAGVALVGRMQLFLMVAVTSVFYPRFVASDEAAGKRDLRHALVLLVTALALTVGLVTAAPELLLRLAVGSEFVEQTTELRLYSLFIAVHSVAALLLYFVLAGRSSRVLTGAIVVAFATQVGVPILVDRTGVALAGGYVIGSTVMLVTTAAAMAWPRPGRRVA